MSPMKRSSSNRTPFLGMSNRIHRAWLSFEFRLRISMIFKWVSRSCLNNPDRSTHLKNWSACSQLRAPCNTFHTRLWSNSGTKFRIEFCNRVVQTRFAIILQMMSSIFSGFGVRCCLAFGIWVGVTDPSCGFGVSVEAPVAASVELKRRRSVRV